MELIINDLPQHGVLIHGPESPGFRDRLFALVAIPPDLEDDALRYSIVVENQTPQHILRITFVWRPYPQEGWQPPFGEGAGSRSNPIFNNLLGSLIKPGEQCPWSLLEGHCFWRLKAVMATPEVSQRERRDQLKTRFAASVKWSVDIDGVLFSDGVFVGPDTTQWFDHLEAEIRAASDLIAELNRKLDDGEDAFAHAEQYASITKEQIQALYSGARSHALNLEIISAWTKKTTAMNVIARWRKFGEMATVEWIRASAKSQIPLVRR
jgi:hypothetical protein